MKTQKLILTIFAIQISSCLFAQIKVVTGGNVVLSRKIDPSAWVLVGETEQNIGKIYPRARLNSKAVNTLCLTLNHEAFTQDVNDWVWVSAGRSNYGNAKHWITISGTSHNSFTTTLGNTYARSFLKASDINIKTNIETLTGALNIVKQLRGVSYHYIPESFCGDSCDDVSLTAASNDRLHFGFISQEVAQVVPNLTQDVEAGVNTTVKALDYDEIIPLLVEAIKELDERLSACCGSSLLYRQNQGDSTNSFGKSSGITGDDSLNNIDNKNNRLYGNCKLYQNNPNPFNEKSTISFEVFNGFKSAKIYIYNLQGEQIKSININNSGKGSIEIPSSDLKAGIYFYSLFVDNKEIDTYKMILTE
jgi:hypothetical protein